MSELALEVCNVWKKFHRGELYDSLRDFVPALFRRVFRRAPPRTELAAGDFWALKDVDFQLKRGEAIGVIGPNGAGKSTLLKILSRILRPNRGSYRVNGRLRSLIEVAAGFHLDLTGRENVYLHGSILGMRKRQIDSRFDEIVAFSGVEEFIDTPVKRFSSGMMARLGFAVAAHMDPEILLVDEVLSVGDAAFRAKCLDHMQHLINDNSVSVVFISHNLEQVRQLCDRAIVLDRGAMRFLGDVGQACQVYYDCFRRSESLPNLTAGNGGRINRVDIFDEQGLPAFRIGANRPFRIRIAYQLERDFPSVGAFVAFAPVGGLPLAGCNTSYDTYPLCSRSGNHEVWLTIESLPFCAGDYLVLPRLFAGQANILDDTYPPQPLSLEGSHKLSLGRAD
jgi:lipopolysaccharide transport system ATP-binding protein